MTNTSWIKSRLDKAEAEFLLRDTRPFPGVGGRFETTSGSALSFSSNDYLNLAGSAVPTRSEHAEPSGICSSRLISGTSQSHERLEKALARFLGRESSLVFGSGYLANLGLASSLLRRDDIVFSDRLVHASMIDAVQLSRAKHIRFRHNDCGHLESLLETAKSKRSKQQRFIILTESVFSMDGDLAPLSALASLAESYDADLIVDEAHAIGVFGPSGAGRVPEDELQDRVLAVTASMSKSFASYGGLIAGDNLVRRICVQQSRSFIYNTALPPRLADECAHSLEVMQAQATAGEVLLRNADYFRSRISAAGYSVCASRSQIVPVLIGCSETALRIANDLAKEEIFCHAIRPPTVPVGSERLRFSITLAHSKEDLEYAAERLRHYLSEGGVRV